jgi:hypothetical protein
VPQPFLGFSLQSFPLTEVAHPSRGHMLPCSYPPTCRSTPSKSLLLPVSPTPTLLTQLPGSPDSYRSPFHEQARFPVALGPERWDYSLPPASPTSKLYSFCKSVRTEPSCPGSEADTLLTFAPLEDWLSTPQNLKPAQTRKPEHESPTPLQLRQTRRTGLTSASPTTHDPKDLATPRPR